MPFHFRFRTGDAWPFCLMIALFLLHQQFFVRVRANRAQRSIVTENKISSVCGALPQNSHFESSLGFSSGQE